MSTSSADRAATLAQTVENLAQVVNDLGEVVTVIPAASTVQLEAQVRILSRLSEDVFEAAQAIRGVLL